jgi:hypothetical protein
MNPILTHVFRFIVFSLAQTFILNKLDLGFGAQVFLLPLYLFLLPFETNVLVLMAIAFGLGIYVDVLSNTMGLNASSLVFFAFLRPLVFNLFRPRDGYDSLKTPTIKDMGTSWFYAAFVTLLGAYLLWYFTLEFFRLSEILLILRNILSSLLITLVFVTIIQLFFLKRGV